MSPSLKKGFIKTLIIFLSLFAAVLFMSACTQRKGELGSERNPVKLFLVPSIDARLLTEEGNKLKKYLEQATPYKFKVAIPASYIAVVEAFGTKRADISGLNTFGYLLAHGRYGAEARLTLLRYGSQTYQAMIIAQTKSEIKNLADLDGKKFAFVDPSSASGYLLPLKLLKDNKIKIKDSVFAQKHDNVIMMVYQGHVDAGAAFYTPPHNGQLEDARRLVQKQYPDVESKIKILALTDPVPNDPIVFRKDLSEEMKTKITDALLNFLKTEDGKKTFYAIYGADGLIHSSDSMYDGFRKIMKESGASALQFAK